MVPIPVKGRSHYTEASPASKSEAPLSISPLGGSERSIRPLSALQESIKVAYLQRFVKVAQEEQRKFGIPASIILATALRESEAGTASLAQAHNNHFGLVCGKNWVGSVATDHNQCYRHYDKAWSSFRDFSLLLQTDKWSGVKKYPLQDYKNWAQALSELGFGAQNSHFSADIIAVIEQYQLNRLVDIE